MQGTVLRIIPGKRGEPLFIEILFPVWKSCNRDTGDMTEREISGVFRKRKL